MARRTRIGLARQREAYENSPLGRFEAARRNFGRLQAYGWTHDDEVRRWGRTALRLAEQHFPAAVSGMRESLAHFEQKVASR